MHGGARSGGDGGGKKDGETCLSSPFAGGSGNSGNVTRMLTFSPDALSVLESQQDWFTKYHKKSFFVIMPAAMKKLNDRVRTKIDKQFATMREKDELGTGNVVVDAGMVSLEEKQCIGDVCVGEGVKGKGLKKYTVLCEYVGKVLTEEESRKSASTNIYGLTLPWPSEEMQTPGLVLDAGTAPVINGPLFNGKPLRWAMCIAAKLNDPTIIQERPDEPTDSDSNGEGNSQFVCKDGKEANCGIYYVYCEKCNAVEASVTAAYDPSMRKRKREVRHQHFHALIVTVDDISDEEEPLTLDYGDGYWPEQVNIMKYEKEYELLQKE